MAEPMLPHDEVNDYLLGRLAPAARRKFAARLARDAELRQLVRDLEEGLLALALTAPPRQPPRELWTRIAAVAFQPVRQLRPARRNFWMLWPAIKWPASAGALAVGLAVALLIHAFWLHPVAPAKSALLPGGVAGGNFGASRQSNPAANVTHPAAGSETNRLASQDHSPRTPAVPAPLAGTVNPDWPVPGGVRNLPEATLAGGPSRPSAVRRAASPGAGSTMDGTNHLVAPDLERPFEVVNLSDPTVAELAPSLGVTDPAGYLGFDPFSGVEPSSIGIFSLGSSVSLPAWEDDMFVVIDPSLLPAGAGEVRVWSMAGDGQVAFIGAVALGRNPIIIHIINADISGWHHYYATIDGTNVIVPFP